MTQDDKDMLIGSLIGMVAVVVFGLIAAIPYEMRSVGIGDFIDRANSPIMTIKLLFAAGMFGLIALGIIAKLRGRGRK